jgi:hypothetical protein
VRREATASLRLPLSFCCCASSHLLIRTLSPGKSGSRVRTFCSCYCRISFPTWLTKYPSLWSRFLFEKLTVTGQLKQIPLLASSPKFQRARY